MVKVNFFVLATDYNIKPHNHLVLSQYQFNSFDRLDVSLQLAMAGNGAQNLS